MRPNVAALVAMGPFPESDGATEEHVDHRVALLESIPIPITADEAIALVGLFGPDDYFGLSFSVRRLVESAEGWPIWEVLDGDSPWVRDLRVRAINSGFVPPGRT